MFRRFTMGKATRVRFLLLLRVLTTCSTLGGFVVVAQLSIPQYDHNSTQSRQAEIDAVAAQISNQPRFQVVAGESYPLPPGPIPLDGSLAQLIVVEELGLLAQYSGPDATALFSQAAMAKITSLEDYLPFYQRLKDLNIVGEVPLTAQTFGDVEFGQDRLTIKGFRLRQVTETLTSTRIPLSKEQLKGLCGAHSLKDLIKEKRLYVEDLSFASKYNDKSQPHKHVPSIKGYFCVNRKKMFLPMAIHILDTNLVYTPYDDIDEWRLAKMALNAAGINAQAWDHFVNSHIMLEPIRVELLRSISSRHPVYVLMEHHLLQIFGNEILALEILLSANTTLDRTFGWGATGALRYLHDESLKFDFSENFFIKQIQKNGLDDIPNAKVFEDIQDVFSAIKVFVHDFVTLYYSPQGETITGGSDPPTRKLKEHRGPKRVRGDATSKTPRGETVGKSSKKGHVKSRPQPKAPRSNTNTDAAVAADEELQNWFSASSKVVPGFPSTVNTVDGLVDTLSNLIFRTSVLHHAMSNNVLWHIISFPYSLPGLFAPLPTKKGQKPINLQDFVVPLDLFPPLTVLVSIFVRPFGPEISILQSYDTLEFNSTARKAITNYESRLKKIEGKVIEREKMSKRPYTILMPSHLPHYIWT